MNGFQYQHLKAKQSKKPFIPVSSLAATETFHFAEGSESIILFSKKQNRWQTLDIFCPRLNQDPGVHEKVCSFLYNSQKDRCSGSEPRNKTKHWERGTDQRFSLKLHGDDLSPELLHSFPTCPTIQGNILLRLQFSWDSVLRVTVKSLMPTFSV